MAAKPGDISADTTPVAYNLEHDGLVCGEHAATDRRVIHVHLTETALSKIEAVCLCQFARDWKVRAPQYSR